MTFEQIIQIISQHGMSVVLMAYFLVKDWKWNDKITATLNEVKEVLTAMKTLLPLKKDGD